MFSYSLRFLPLDVFPEIWRITFKHKKKKKNTTIYCRNNQVLELGAERGSGVSKLGDTQNPSRQGPEQPTPAAWSWGTGLDNLLMSLPTKEENDWTDFISSSQHPDDINN